MQKISTFLMFEGHAEEAMSFYISLFENSRVLNLARYGPDQPDFEGKVLHAVFELNGQEFMCMDSNIQHGFTFTPSMSLFIICKSEPEIDRLYKQLSQGGQVLMELDRYPFSEKFTWVNDRFGVSWQLNLVKEA